MYAQYYQFLSPLVYLASIEFNLFALGVRFSEPEPSPHSFVYIIYEDHYVNMN